MNDTRSFATQALVLIFVIVALFLATLYLIAGAALAGLWWPILGVSAVAVLVLWLGVQRLGRQIAAPAQTTELPKERPAPQVKAPPAPPSDTPALLILSILQRKGRFIDFLQEDLSPHSDEQIGAAVRGIHEGCKQALDEYVTLEPIFAQDEGSTVTVESGFDAHEVRLTGNVAGDPPFKGALRHCGWRVVRIDLPERVQDNTTGRILAPAEVEIV